jgi:hypothetical protein
MTESAEALVREGQSPTVVAADQALTALRVEAATLAERAALVDELPQSCAAFRMGRAPSASANRGRHRRCRLPLGSDGANKPCIRSSPFHLHTWHPGPELEKLSPAAICDFSNMPHSW